MSRRHRGGIPRNIDYLRASLSTKDKKKWAQKGSALHDVAGLIDIISGQVVDRDEDCGYFLAELLAYLSKNQLRFVSTNEVFRKTWTKWESARPSTSKQSALRRLIHEIILNTERRRNVAQIAQHLTIPPDLKPDRALLNLPDFAPLPNVVEEWVDKVIYPELQKRRLVRHPEIGNLKKATDENGKFQLSRLRPLICATALRIAALPRRYFFEIA